MVSRLRHPWEAASLPGYSILFICIVMLAIVGCTVGTGFSVIRRRVEAKRCEVDCAAVRLIRMHCAGLLSVLPTKVPTGA